MVGTRAQRSQAEQMERERLEQLTVEELREEAMSQRVRTTAPKSAQDGAAGNSGPSGVPTASSEQSAINQLAQSINMCLEQQRFMMEEIRALSRRAASNTPNSSQGREDAEPVRSPAISSASPAQAKDRRRECPNVDFEGGQGRSDSPSVGRRHPTRGLKQVGEDCEDVV